MRKRTTAQIMTCEEILEEYDCDNIFQLTESLNLTPRIAINLDKIELKSLDNAYLPYSTFVTFNKGNIPENLVKTDPEHKTFNSSNDVNYLNSSMNQGQREAIQMSLDCVDSKAITSTIIHGPPGTGKTTVLVELLYQLAIVKKLSVLVCAHSNQAVDNVLDKFITSREKHDLKVNFTRLNPQHDRHEPYNYFDLVLSRKTDPKKRLHRQDVQILFATLHSTAGETAFVPGQIRSSFDVVVIDEAGQNFDVDCWGACFLTKKLILAGDAKQLSPFIV